VIRRPVTRVQLRAELARRLPFDAEIMICQGREIVLKILARDNRFVFGVYRRHMKVISYLGTFDRLFGVPVTTRNWNTITAIARVLGNADDATGFFP
jgi:hypothetical protein